MEVAADVRELDERRRLAAERRLAQLRRAPRQPERRVDALLVGRVRKRPSASTYARDPVARTSSVPKRAGSRDDELDGHAFDRDADARAAPRARAPRRSAAAPRTCRATGVGSPREHDDRELERGVAQRRGSPATSPPSAAAIALEQRRAPGSASARAAAAARASRSSAASSRCSVCGPDARHGPQPARRAAVAELVRGRDAERAADLDHPLRRDPEEAAEPDELGLHLALELVELRDLAGLDELAQPPRDARADPAQLLDAAGRDELRDRRRRRRGSARPRGGTRATCRSWRPTRSSSAAKASSRSAIAALSATR